LDPAHKPIDAARLSYQGEKALKVFLDTTDALKQSKVNPNLEGNFDSPKDPITGRTTLTHEKVYSGKTFNPC
jgi:hypothetical protein